MFKAYKYRIYPTQEQKAGFVTVEKKSENGSSPRNYYMLHNDIIGKAISEKAPELTESK